MKLFGIQLGRSDPAPVRAAMEAHRKAHPSCQCGCGRTPVDVHHIIPVSVDPEKAAMPSNLISLHHDCHIVLGHAGDPACRHYCPDLVDQLIQRKVKRL